MASVEGTRKKVLTLFGTRPEVIKLAPIIKELERRRDVFQAINVTSSQHTDLLYPFIHLFGLRIDHDLKIMEPNQTLSRVAARVLAALDPILAKEAPDVILVQGDTTTAMAGAIAGFHRKVLVGHVEAGLRSGNPYSPYPEEMNRRLISQAATYHFAATRQNHDTLLQEGLPAEFCHVTGNPVVDSLNWILKEKPPSHDMQSLLEGTSGYKRIVLTTHRRESFGEVMGENLKVLRDFIDRHEDTVLIFPVHPNPSVVEVSHRILGQHPRIHLISPITYENFVFLLSRAWLIVSDSGGVQEEAPSLRKPLLILRENTERPEAVQCGVGKLVGGRPERLAVMLEEFSRDRRWLEQVERVENPFGRGDSAQRIVDILEGVVTSSTRATVKPPVAQCA